MVNYEWYRTFKAIYESGTLTSAAQVLFASQPGVSLHLNSLEAYVGFKLFERKARRMIPTERGKVLYAFLQEPLSRLEEAEKVFKRSTNDATPTVSIGMCFEIGKELQPKQNKTYSQSKGLNGDFLPAIWCLLCDTHTNSCVL